MYTFWGLARPILEDWWYFVPDFSLLRTENKQYGKAIMISQSLYFGNVTIVAAFLKPTLLCSKINIGTKDKPRPK